MKGPIHIHNYEAWLLDYAEGNLDAAGVAQLNAFLKANPHLAIEPGELDLPHLENETVTFQNRDTLKKETEHLEDAALLNYLEGQGTEADRLAFEQQLQNDAQLKSSFAIYAKTIVAPDSSILLPGKNKLHKNEDDLLLNNLPLLYSEGMLSAEERTAFEENMAENTALRQEVVLLQKARLQADTEVVFPNKQLLKKEAIVIGLFSYRNMAHVAAALLLLAGLYGVLFYLKPVQTVEVSEKPVFDASPAKTQNTVTTATPAVNEPLPVVKQQKDKVNKAQRPPSKVPTGATQQQLLANQKTMGGNINGSKNVVSEENKPLEAAALTGSAMATVQNTTAAQKLPEIKPAEIKPAETSGLALVQSSGAEPAANLPEHTTYKTVDQLALESDNDTDAEAAAAQKTGFWQRAVNLAKRANTFGVKDLESEEGSNKSFSISFRGFSVEKR